MRTHGIDLAVQSSDTALATIDWNGPAPATLTLNSAPASDEMLLEVLLGAFSAKERVGIDVPLGWPVGFGELIESHAALAFRPPKEASWATSYAGFRLRRTDHQVAGRNDLQNIRPLSVSADKLGATAMRGAWLLGRLVESEPNAVDRTGTDGVVVEVYPAAALRLWGLTKQSYKSGDFRKEEQAAIWHGRDRETGGGLGALFAPDTREPQNDHEIDAVVAAVIARLAGDGQTVKPAPEDWALAKTEGWIHVPIEPTSLRDLASDSSPESQSIGNYGNSEPMCGPDLRHVGSRSIQSQGSPAQA